MSLVGPGKAVRVARWGTRGFAAISAAKQAARTIDACSGGKGSCLGEAAWIGLDAAASLVPASGRTTTFVRNFADEVPTTGGASPVRVGQAGEQAVRRAVDIGNKLAIAINGRTRIPDGLTSTTLSEVKNVRTLSYTRQLRDFADYAEEAGRQFDLYVRPSTTLSGPLEDAIESGVINLLPIP